MRLGGVRRGWGGARGRRYREYGKDLWVLRRAEENWGGLGGPVVGERPRCGGRGVLGEVLGTEDTGEGGPPDWGDLGVCVVGGGGQSWDWGSVLSCQV